MWLLIAFIAVPLIEIALFIQVGGAIGLWPTLLIVLITAILGTFLVRQQGLMAMNQLRSRLGNLSDPTDALAHGAMILFSGALLLTPGFFTDAVGFALLVPAVRDALTKYLRQKVKVQSFGFPPQHQGDPRDDSIIDAEYEEIDPEPRRTQGPSGWTKNSGGH
jgi:UPF0716 protein FxsA